MNHPLRGAGIAAVLLMILPAQNANAFFDPTGPAQLAYLAQILAEDLKRFEQLHDMIQQGHAQTDFLKWVNAGVDNAVGIAATLPLQDQAILGELKNYPLALSTVGTLYGRVPKSAEEPMESLHDETIAESFQLANSAKDYATGQEQNAARASEMANTMSPKGAERLTVETNAQLLHAVSQLLRVDGELLKLHGESLALENKRDKASVDHFNQAGADVTTSLSNFSGDLSLPKF
jgi:hypothetical protein